MGHRHRIAILVASLAVVLVAVRCRETSTTEMYDADYRGPETHSSLPPPELPRTGTIPKTRRGGEETAVELEYQFMDRKTEDVLRTIRRLGCGY
ncbi:hypothetical protein C4D60_Mb03t18990 [Musa balbisiana]|uniref:Secreted protein n=1 Tax=Musa balbisiana TaxID=52838 RepID=A0A4S8JAW3_MUSBA|nr:hypothetical protein C4D60_Mb03t18990 [Musa balbisiana]